MRLCRNCSNLGTVSGCSDCGRKSGLAQPTKQKLPFSCVVAARNAAKEAKVLPRYDMNGTDFTIDKNNDGDWVKHSNVEHIQKLAEILETQLRRLVEVADRIHLWTDGSALEEARISGFVAEMDRARELVESLEEKK